MKNILLVLFFSISVVAIGQKDSIIFKNGNYVVGEIKSMDRGVVQIETDYSDSDFKIEWDGIQEIYTESRFLLTLSDGSRYNGNFYSSGEKKITINDDSGMQKETSISEVVYVNSIDNSFSSRLSANIDLGYSLAKTNNQQQLNGNFRIGYLADRSSLDLYYNTLFSRQDNVEEIKRNDGGLGFRYFLPSDWYVNTNITFLSNTEQSLKLRTNGKIGIGNYIVHSNQAYWGFGTGIAINNESFNLTASDAADSLYKRQSYEAYLGTELNLYDIGDLDLFTNMTAYPSITESGRWRADFRFDAKYDDFILEDFYIRAGFTANYDNQPAEAGKELDYVFTTGFGWKW